MVDLPDQATASLADPAHCDGGAIGAGDIAPFMNPFIDTALDPTMRRLAQQQNEVQAGIGANAAASGMFGGIERGSCSDRWPTGITGTRRPTRSAT